jgi:hypothetical protein
VAQLGVVFEKVGYACHKGSFGTYHKHLHIVLKHKLFDGGEVVVFEVYIGAATGSACVARGYEKLLALGTLGYFVSYGVFAAARTEK